MINITELKELYPIVWLTWGPDPVEFTMGLATQGAITWDEFDEYKRWYEGQPPAETVPPEIPAETRPVPTVYELVQQYPEWWMESGPDTSVFLARLTAEGIISVNEAEAFYKELSDYMAEARQQVTTPTGFKGRLESWVWKQVRDYLAPAFRAVLGEMFTVWKSITPAGLLYSAFMEAPGKTPPEKTVRSVWDALWTAASSSLKQGFKWIDEQIEAKGRQAYDGLMRLMQESGPVTPERAPALALKVYGFAFGMGLAAHGVASAIELLHPLKRIGVHQVSAMLGDFAGFSRIAAATMGVYTSIALAQPLKYAVSDMTRSLLPDDKWLTIMAVKPDITIPEFRRNMAYQGYSDHWIDKIQRTMYHEPRYFELKMMSEDHAATEEWLYEKSRRAGFIEADSKIMVSSYIKSATRTQRMDYYRQAFYLFKEGYIGTSVFRTLLDGLELRPEGAEFARRAADLAYMLDYIKDLVSLYTDQFSKDIISEDSLRLALVALGMRLERADLLVRKAVIKKKPKPSKPATKAVEPSLTKIQTKYVTLYTTQYRKDLIDEQTFLSNLLQLGIDDELAAVTVAIEEAKKFKPAAAE